MKIILFVEGKTERVGLPEFLRQWLYEQPAFAVAKPQLKKPIGFDGYPDYMRKISPRVHAALRREPKACAVGLLDLYGLQIPGFDLPHDRDERYRAAKSEIEQRVDHPRFIQHFAVHEIEA